MPSQNVRPIYPTMFASGIFIDSFSSKQDEEVTPITAIKAFQADIVIVIDDKLLEMNIQKEINEMNQENY